MRAVIVQDPGGPDQLQLVDRPVPQVGAEELLVAVRATSVNRADVLQREGRYPVPPGASDVLGLEVAGEVMDIGGAVREWRVGDRVCALLASGGYAEYAAVPAAVALPVPRDMPWREAGGLAEVFSTAYDSMLVRGRLRQGETVLIHGVASGVGTAATQLAARAGARVLGTASTRAKLEAARDLGAVAGINYIDEDFVERVAHLTDGHGVDVILDVVGGPYLQRNLDALAIEGRLVLVGLQGGTHAELSLGQLLSRRLTVTGSVMRARTLDEKAQVARGVREHVLPGFSDGSLRVVVDRAFELADIAEAHRALEQGDHIGKVVLEVSAG